MTQNAFLFLELLSLVGTPKTARTKFVIILFQNPKK